MSNDNDSNIVNLTDIKHDDIKARRAKLEKDISDMIAMIETISRLRWASYQSHIQKGFSKEEALVLCTKLTL